MRVLLVLLALVVTPFVAGVAQGKVKKDKVAEHCAKRLAKLAKKGDKRIKEKDIALCVEPPAPPLPPAAACANSAPGTGTGSISGEVYVDAAPWGGLSSWCIQLSGPYTATAVTDLYGSFSFTGVPAGTYSVCEVVQSGWTEAFPTAMFGVPCTTGYGWQLTLADGEPAEWNNFGNIPQ